MRQENDPPGGGDTDRNLVDESPDRTVESAQLTAIYVGGPNDGETEEISAAPDPGDAPGVVRVVGFELWPVANPGPTGRYEPETSARGYTVRFIWQAYTPVEQTRRQQEEEEAGRIMQPSALTRIMSRLFWDTRIFDWYVRRVLLRPRAGAPARSDKPDSSHDGAGNPKDD